MTALTVYIYQGISRLGTQTNKVIKLDGCEQQTSAKRLAEREKGRFGVLSCVSLLWTSPQ